MHVSMKLVAGALALGLSACAVDSAARTASAFDPSSPEAPEVPVLDMAAMLVTRDAASQAPEVPPSSEAPAKPSAPTSVVYTCPMHPDVVSPTPGRCPKCGMTLVPREGTAPRGEKP